MKVIKRNEEQDTAEHKSVGVQLDEMEQKLADHARRLRILEIEAGIFKPPLHEAGSSE
jgi:hypothetical protein